jgi:GTPase SAR1 family protein
MKLIYIIGAPGSGKTTLTQTLMQKWVLTAQNRLPVKHETYTLTTGETAISLGWTNPPFSGTDTLPYTAITQIEQWLPTVTADIIIGEGDRLAIDRYLNLATQLGQLHLYYLDTNPAVASDRRAMRSIQNNTATQNPSWVSGRATKHLNLAQRWNAKTLPGNLPPQQLAGIILNDLHPAPGNGWE